MHDLIKPENISSTPHLPVYSYIYKEDKQFSPSHWHNHIEILFCLSGILHITLQDQEYIITANEFVVLNTNVIHSTNSQEKVHVLLLQIPYSYLSSLLSDFHLIRFQELYTNATMLSSPYFQQMQSQLSSLAQIFANKEKGYELSFLSLLHQFLYILYRHFSHELSPYQKESKQIAKIKDVLNYVSLHYTEPISLTQAAAIASLNPEYFCRTFKRCTGNTFLEYTNLVRLQHIYDELFSTDDTIIDLLERNGFTNYKVFSRMFRERYGTTPDKLRKQKSVKS